MAKKLIVVVTLILIVTLILSACAKVAPDDLPIATQTPTISPILKNTATKTITPTVTPTNTPTRMLPTGEVVFHLADEVIAYNWYSYIPESIDPSKPVNIWVTGISGYGGDLTYGQMTQYSRVLLDVKIPWAEKYQLVILTPTIPRTPYYYTASLNSTIFQESTPLFYQRPDLKVNQMIDTLISDLRDDNYLVNEKVFMEGFSIAGIFAQRYAILHPDRVQAIVAGMNTITFPESKYGTSEINWPVGVSNYFDLLGYEFDVNTYKKIPQFIFVGDKDILAENIRIDEIIGTSDQEKFYLETFGYDNIIRTQNQIAYLNNLGYRNIYFKLYHGVGHDESSPAILDIMDFYENHKQPLIEPTPNVDTPIIIRTSISPKDGMTMVFVPEGEFIVNRSFEQSWKISETLRPVFLDSFWMDQTEITNSMYHKCVDEGSCLPPSDINSKTRVGYYNDNTYSEYPVINVTWQQADVYCKWAGRMLPTAAEWDKAALGFDGRYFPWGNEHISKGLANIYNHYSDTSKVGSFPLGISQYGALDMVGNVMEYIADWNGPDTQLYTSYINPLGVETGNEKILRGGKFSSGLEADIFYATTRLHFYQNTVGFRCSYSPVRLSLEPAPTSTPRPIFRKVNPLDDMVMVKVPGGDFLMGAEEKIVSVNEFWIDQTEVSNRQYEKCVAQKKCTPPQDKSSQTNVKYYGNPSFSNFPVINITYKQANEYCTWAGKYLPTEIEWEKAARGTDARYYPWGDGVNGSPANYNNEVGDTNSVSSFPEGASPYGALNLAGNVWEYTTDLYQPEISSTVFAVRGGSWDIPQLSVLERSDMGENDISPSVGFRCISLQP